MHAKVFQRKNLRQKSWNLGPGPQAWVARGLGGGGKSPPASPCRNWDTDPRQGFCQKGPETRTLPMSLPPHQPTRTSGEPQIIGGCRIVLQAYNNMEIPGAWGPG